MTLAERLHTQEAGGSMAEVLDEMRRQKRLTDSELHAGYLFLRDLCAYHGRTGGLVGSTAERVDKSLSVGAGANWTRAHERCQRALDGLHGHERRVLEWMICHRERARPDLATLGRQVSTYSNRDHAIAAAVSAIAGVLRSIMEVYAPANTREAA
jgi:hypothetical protein